MPRVSVVAAKKPTTPLTTFKFLRRDEGRLSYSLSAPATPSAKGAEVSHGDRERRDSKSLREAIAYDMRNARSHDPLGEVVVAVPKKVFPPGRGSEAPAAAKSPDPLRRVPPRMSFNRRPAWVDPEIPARRADALDNVPEDRAQLVPSVVVNTPPPKEFFAERAPYNGTEDDPSYAVRWGKDGLFGTRFGLAPRRMTSVPPHRTDPADMDYDRNYFRGSPPPLREYTLSLMNRSHEEESLTLQLEREVRAVQEERSRYTYAKAQLDRERQRFETYKLDVQHQLDEERANLATLRAQDQREVRKEVNSIDERYKSVSSLLSMERETNKRLVQESESLHAQLEGLTSTMRDSQAAHRAEVARLRREVDSLTRRNSELLAMTKEEQMSYLVTSSPKPGLTAIMSGPGLINQNGNSETVSATVSQESPGKLVDTPISIEDKDNGSTQDGDIPARLVQHVVFDFTPPSSNTASRQRRAKAVEERMQREEEERQQRRLQREQEEAGARKAKDAAAARTAQEERASLVNRKQGEKAARHPTQSNYQLPEDVLKERKAAEHPLLTPRVMGRNKNTTAAKPVAVPMKLKPHLPTRKELLQEMEPMPEENYPEDEILSETTQAGSPNKREVIYRSGKKEIHYANGSVKVILPSQHVILHFTNGDTKCTFPSGKSTYWYDSAQTTHTQLPSGVQLFEFCATGQSERHMPDGTKEIMYPDGVYKIIHADGSDETHIPDES